MGVSGALAQARSWRNDPSHELRHEFLGFWFVPLMLFAAPFLSVLFTLGLQLWHPTHKHLAPGPGVLIGHRMRRRAGIKKAARAIIAMNAMMRSSKTSSPTAKRSSPQKDLERGASPSKPVRGAIARTPAPRSPPTVHSMSAPFASGEAVAEQGRACKGKCEGDAINVDRSELGVCAVRYFIFGKWL